MKLYAIVDKQKNKIIAISEYKKACEEFFIQNNYINGEYSIIKLTDDKKINSLLIVLDDLYLEEFYGYIIRRKDRLNLFYILERYEKMIVETHDNILDIISSHDLDKYEYGSLVKASDVLKNLYEEDKLNKFKILRDYYNIPNLSKLLEEFNTDFI